MKSYSIANLLIGISDELCKLIGEDKWNEFMSKQPYGQICKIDIAKEIEISYGISKISLFKDAFYLLKTDQDLVGISRDWKERGRKIFCVYGKNSSLIRNRYV